MSRLGILVFCAGVALQAVHVVAQVQTAGQHDVIDTPRELFELFGIDKTSFQQFAHGQALDDAQREQLARVLMRLPQVKLLDVERWSRRGVVWDDIAERPEEYQREFLRVEGHVRRVARVEPPQEIQNRYAVEGYYRCELRLGEKERSAVVFARSVPKKWPVDRPMDERASAMAVFLKIGPESASGESELYFAADRVAWHPATLLGNAGMDYGLLDTIEQQRPITNQDRECFYQMLAAAGRAAAAEPVADTADPASRLAGLMRSPDEHVGELHSFRGVARRAVKIHVSDPDIVARFGLDHYYELVVFLELNGVFEVSGEKVRSYPLVYCVRNLPPGMPMGENIAEVVRASGFMFKKWPYTTQLTEKRPGLRMFSPLFIGKTVFWQRRDEARTLGPIAGGVLIALIAGVAFFVWWFNRRERHTHEAVVAKTHALQDGQSLSDLKLDVPE